MPITASPQMTGVSAKAALGNNGRAKRRKPEVPISRSTAASSTEPAVGASTCASGSQVWNGNIGTLIANTMKNARKTQYWKLNVRNGAIAWTAKTLNVGALPNCAAIAGCWAAIDGYWKYNARMPSSKRTEPNNV